MRTLAIVAVLLVSSVLAGCAGKAKTPEQAPAANFDNLGLEATATTGIIRGVALDEAIRPLAGVNLGIALPDGTLRNTTSVADGAWGFAKLPPGTYFVKAHKAGFIATQVSTDVVAGVAEPPVVKILLKADPSTQPYVSVYEFDAFIGCSLTSPSVSFAACDVGPVKGATNNKFLDAYTADKPPAWLQSEAVWESTQALGSSLSLSYTDFSFGPQTVVNQTDGPSPIFITVNETTARHYNYGINNSITLRLFSTTTPGTDVVPEEQVHQAYAQDVYGPLNSTGAPKTYQDQVADPANKNDPTGLEIVGNPFNDPNCIKYPVLFNSCYRFGGAGAMVNQRVNVYTHIFYGYAPPAGWRFTATGEAPPPPI
jgi:hypothetical protein